MILYPGSQAIRNADTNTPQIRALKPLRIFIRRTLQTAPPGRATSCNFRTGEPDFVAAPLQEHVVTSTIADRETHFGGAYGSDWTWTHGQWKGREFIERHLDAPVRL